MRHFIVLLLALLVGASASAGDNEWSRDRAAPGTASTLEPLDTGTTAPLDTSACSGVWVRLFATTLTGMVQDCAVDDVVHDDALNVLECGNANLTALIGTGPNGVQIWPAPTYLRMNITGGIGTGQYIHVTCKGG